MMVQILSGLITYLLLTIYCHEEHDERVSIRRVRQLRNQICNEVAQQATELATEQAIAMQKQKRRCRPKHRKRFKKVHATF